jgi:hypothetical protein
LRDVRGTDMHGTCLGEAQDSTTTMATGTDATTTSKSATTAVTDDMTTTEASDEDGHRRYQQASTRVPSTNG